LRHRLLLVLILAAPLSARGQAQRFDIQSWRPAPGPRDLVILPQTQPLAHFSPAVGAFLHFQLDPLVLVNADGDRIADVVRNRLELHVHGAIGLGNWAEVGVVVPVILFQQSDNLEPIGEEGTLRSTGVGDLALMTKVPILRRLSYARGLGLSLGLRVNFPLPSAQEIFAGDGAVTYNPTVLLDYRFAYGILLASQVGVHFRPEGQFLDTKLGPAITAAIGGEAPIVRRWGLGAVAGLYANFPVLALMEDPSHIPAQGLLGVRWYADFGVTFTAGLEFGAACRFAVPTFGFFLSAIWVPAKTKEHEAILHFKRPPEDPDGDGVIGEHDRCPNLPGPVENHGCPILDTDKDGIPDHLDQCPTLPGRFEGCPRVYAHRNKIRVLEKVHFATDQDVILPESFSVLEEVAEVIKAHPEWQEILIEGHCDFRASDAYNLDLSQRRANSVMRFLTSRGVEPSRLRAQGFGRSRPIADNRTEEGMALNRRVEFTLVRVAPEAKPVGGN
jgi:outer membrane protein OmpA-like peptidoglycan-associated protein